ncbi:hypothetical protein BjapCC829_31680 [Bradyrhizobium barranii]|uniref:Right handed beta helix domain-containing protein n=1 Tax=Bradyrhizobium barranii TaxID=2992140 RepID=A0ABY3QFS6_9BRAD|nr:hypothetical protein [Bradyrhizobium japonicum]UFW84478.1 hypothetical protein BjapCC829_31680 [Bradyrhizobium japonicum]
MNTTVRDMGGSGFTIASAAAGLIKATLSNVKVINAASGIGVGAGAAVHLSNSVVSSNSVAGIAISGGGINIDATTISFNTIGVKQVGGSIDLSNNDLSPLCRHALRWFAQDLDGCLSRQCAADGDHRGGPDPKGRLLRRGRSFTPPWRSGASRSHLR